jgi:hypothetical protein
MTHGQSEEQRKVSELAFCLNIVLGCPLFFSHLSACLILSLLFLHRIYEISKQKE